MIKTIELLFLWKIFNNHKFHKIYDQTDAWEEWIALLLYKNTELRIVP